MSYILIILGFILIFLSIRNSNTTIKDNNDRGFSDILDNSVNNLEINLIKNQFNEILDRIDNLEKSIIFLNDQLEGRKKEDEEELNLIIDNSNNLSDSFDNYIEKDINSLIFQLSDEGKDLDEICSSLKLGKGEVLLRLGLRK